jgi:hypothetical protein
MEIYYNLIATVFPIKSTTFSYLLIEVQIFRTINVIYKF